MLAVRAPQSKPARIAFSILSASIKAIDVDGERRRLAVAERVARKKARRAVAAQIRNDHAVARRRQQRRDIDKAVNVVGPAVQKNDRRAIGGTGFGVADIQDAGIDLLQRGERRVRPRLDRGQLLSALSCRIVHPQNRSCRAGRQQWSWPQRQESGGDDGRFLRAVCYPSANLLGSATTMVDRHGSHVDRNWVQIVGLLARAIPLSNSCGDLNAARISALKTAVPTPRIDRPVI